MTKGGAFPGSFILLITKKAKWSSLLICVVLFFYACLLVLTKINSLFKIFVSFVVEKLQTMRKGHFADKVLFSPPDNKKVYWSMEEYRTSFSAK